MSREKAIFAAGCFWHVQDAFDRIKGVLKTTAGYTGGRTANPTYLKMHFSDTGHAEAVLVEFDPSKVSYGKLLDAFWAMHDPTQANGQGLDRGSQYRSAIFFLNAAQEKAAKRSKAAHAGKYKKPIVTEIVRAGKFYPAEEYHQHYFAKTGKSACPFK